MGKNGSKDRRKSKGRDSEGRLPGSGNLSLKGSSLIVDQKFEDDMKNAILGSQPLTHF